MKNSPSKHKNSSPNNQTERKSSHKRAQTLPTDSIVKLQPFSHQCTAQHIRQQLETFRYTLRKYQSNQDKKVTKSSSLITRLNGIVHLRKHKHTSRSPNIHRTNSVDHSSHKPTPSFKYSFQPRKTIQHALTQTNQKSITAFDSVPNPVRSKLINSAIQIPNSTLESKNQPKSESLSQGFSKNNCFLFSRSRHKIMRCEMVPQPKKIAEFQTLRSDKYKNFGQIYFKGYLRKYTERKELLGRGGLLKLVNI